VKLLRTMRHENIITLLDIQPPEDPTAFCEVLLVYELMDTNLARIIKSKQALREDHIRYFIYQTLRALKYLHSGNSLHRDLKPSNLLLSAHCDLKICNFDLVRSMSERGPTTDYVTNRWYRAPELLLLCDEFDGAVDLWSVGCILGELLGRKPVFEGKDSVHQLSLVMQTLGTPDVGDVEFLSSAKARNHIKALPSQPKIPFSTLYPDATPHAVDLLENLLVFNPSKRISIADALAHPYFKSLHNEHKEPVADAPLDTNFVQGMDLSLDEIRCKQEFERT
jgi:serine/threonine protein kinase